MPPRPATSALRRWLPPDVEPGAGRGLRGPAAASVWYGVIWGRLGRGDLAWAWWDRVEDTALTPWIAAERGRLLRELGAHAAARELEAPAWWQADDTVDRAMLEVSLAADAIGTGEVGLAHRQLAAARDTLDAAPAGPRRDRQLLRAGWVGVELALLGGATDAMAPPSGAELPRWDDSAGHATWPPRYDAGSDFHRAKGVLFAGVLLQERRLLEVAARLAPPALLWAVQLARADLDPTAMQARAQAHRLQARIVLPPPLGGSGAATS